MKDLSQKGTWQKRNKKNLLAETKVRMACFMTFPSIMWIKEAWKREVKLEGKSIKNETEEAIKEINVNL